MYKVVLIFLLSIFLFISCGSDDKENIYTQYNGIYEITEGKFTYHDEKYFRLEADDLYTKNDGMINHLGLSFCKTSDKSSCEDGFISNYSIAENHPSYAQIQRYNGRCIITATFGHIKNDGNSKNIILSYENKKGTIDSIKCDFDTLDANIDNLTTESTDVVKARFIE